LQKGELVTSLNDLERRRFRAATDDGLLDIMMAAVVSMFALAPLLSGPLGDFWSSAVFGPLWFVVYLFIRVVREHVLAPRIGTVEPGIDRRRRLRRVAIMLFVVNGLAFGVGVGAGLGFWVGWLDLSGWVYPISLGVVALIGFSLAAYAMSVWRSAIYGLLLALAPVGGEWLWRNDLAEHHGFPVGFGAVALVMLTTGIIRLITLVRVHLLPGTQATA
jgi:hypothetical protein